MIAGSCHNKYFQSDNSLPGYFISNSEASFHSAIQPWPIMSLKLFWKTFRQESYKSFFIRTATKDSKYLELFLFIQFEADFNSICCEQDQDLADISSPGKYFRFFWFSSKIRINWESNKDQKLCLRFSSGCHRFEPRRCSQEREQTRMGHHIC